MTNVVTLSVPTKLDLPADRILQSAVAADLECAIVIGRTKDGVEYFASSLADGGDVLWLMERFKLQLVSSDA